MKTLRATTVAIAAVILLAGCAESPADAGAGGAASPSSTELEVTSVTVGVVPISDAATIYVAQERGYFEDEGLTVTTESMQNAAAIVPGVVNGQVQFGHAGLPSVISAASEGLPLVFVANGSNVAVEADTDQSALVVAPGSGIASPKDLDGKVVAVNALQALGDLVTRQVIDDDGGDASTVTFVALPFPEMIAAVERGDADAAMLVEPFTSAASVAGLETIATPFSDVLAQGKSIAGFFTSQQFLQQSPNTVAAFTRALQRAAEDASADVQLVRDALVEHGKVDPAVAAGMRLPGYSPELSAEAVDRFVELMVEQEYLTGDVPAIADIIHP